MVKFRDIFENDDYRGSHTAPGPRNGSPMHDLHNGEDGGAFPEDVYDHKVAGNYYGHGYGAVDKSSALKLSAAKGKPNHPVTIYRAIPKHIDAEINRGDWVTHNKDYAKIHGEGPLDGKYKIISKKVKAKDLFSDGNSIHEFGYHPQD